jgi:lipooligosaccharide transport system permease protein
MSPIAQLLAAADWRALAVLRRNALVYLRNWRTAFFPPAMEPVIFFLAFGFGLRGYVGEMDYEGHAIDYATYVAPGLLAYTSFTTPFYEALYSAYVRMFYQKTWDGILATQVELPHIVWGEILWAGVRGGMNVSIVAVVLAIFDLVGAVELELTWLVVSPAVGFAVGVLFGSFGLLFTVIVPSIDHMNYPVFLVGIPLSLVSNTYFPVETDNAVVHAVMQLNPIYHLAESYRAALVTGTPSFHVVWLVGLMLIYTVVLVLVVQRLTRRRVLGE